MIAVDFAIMLPSSQILTNWQGRRDSNPQVRFWRPTV
jgi:hypothetical protein